jgi:hypothetical protein
MTLTVLTQNLPNSVRLRREPAPASYRAGDGRSAWPKSPRALAGRLRRAQTPLRALGIEIAFSREGRGGARIIRMSASHAKRNGKTVSTVSTVSDDDPSNSENPALGVGHAPCARE